MANKKVEMREARKSRIRRKVVGTAERPRLTIFRSNFEIYAQVIDDTCGHTLVQASSIDKALKPVIGELRANPPKPPAPVAPAPEAKEEKKGKKDAKAAPAKAAHVDLLNTLIAHKIGEAVAERCKAKGIDKVVFDRNGYIYHGRVKALADAARKAGLNF